VSVLGEINNWLANNQALVVSAGIPIFALIITGWTSFLSHRAKVAEIKLSGRVKLSEYRRRNYDELMRLSARFQTIFLRTASDKVMNRLDSSTVDNNTLLEAIECTNEFLLRSQADPEQVKYFTESAQRCMDVVFLNRDLVIPEENPLGSLRMICKEIMDQEWVRIVRELEGTSP
jgi:hypothetical protein